MTREEALAKLQQIFDKLFLSPVKLTPMLTAREVPEWDSLMQINLVISVERAFAVKFRLGEVERTENVGDFADLIIKRIGER